MNNKFVENNLNDFYYYTIEEFDNTNLVKHLFSSKVGGASSGKYNSLNVGIKTEDNLDDVIKNYEIISNYFEKPIDNFVLSDQVHKTNIKYVTEEDMGKGLTIEMDYKEIDGLITDKKGLVLSTVYADCVPIFYLDKAKNVIGIAHAGWRGTVSNIAGIMVDKFIELFDSSPEDILVGIGPSIGKCCYEVGDEVYNKFNTKFTNTDNLLKSSGKSKWMLNLWEANKILLEEKGVLNRNITVSNLCTFCNSEKFFSFRRDKGITGRMGAFIMLK